MTSSSLLWSMGPILVNMTFRLHICHSTCFFYVERIASAQKTLKWTNVKAKTIIITLLHIKKNYIVINSNLAFIEKHKLKMTICTLHSFHIGFPKFQITYFLWPYQPKGPTCLHPAIQLNDLLPSHFEIL